MDPGAEWANINYLNESVFLQASFRIIEENEENKEEKNRIGNPKPNMKIQPDDWQTDDQLSRDSQFQRTIPHLTQPRT